MPPRSDVCKRGHDLSKAYIRPDGKGRECFECRSQRFRDKQRAAAPPTAAAIIGLKERFATYVAKRGPDDCWPWQGSRSRRTGYGGFRVGYRTARAHVAAFVIASGSLPAGIVCHTCDNPPCCNPAHLYDGTDQTNADDRVARGRTARGDRNGARAYRANRARGERHRSAKLSDDQVAAIRRLHGHGRTQVSLAAEFGVSQSNIGCIVRGETRVPFSAESVREIRQGRGEAI